MYQMLSFIIGIVIAVMISVNGTLSNCYDVFRSAVIIHIVGVIFATLLYCLKKEETLIPSRTFLDLSWRGSWISYNSLQQFCI